MIDLDVRDGRGGAPRTLLILNPAAGQEDTERTLRLLAGAFAVRGVRFDVERTAGPGDAERLAREGAADGYRAVVAVGGDGTVGEVLTGLVGTGVPCGIVARGTGNQVAWNLGLPRRLEDAVDVAVSGVSLPIDLGRLSTGRYFALAAGAGWDAAICQMATRDLKERWGFGAYLYAGLRLGIAPPVARYRIEADGQVIELEAAMVLLANMGRLASSLPPQFPTLELQIVPQPSLQDGLLDVCIFTPRNVPDMAGVLWRVARRRYAGDDRMIFLRAAHVRVESDPPVVAEVDGDPIGHTPLEATVVPAGAHVLVSPAVAERAGVLPALPAASLG